VVFHLGGGLGPDQITIDQVDDGAQGTVGRVVVG
jgi:hypothetical protein